MKMLVRTPTLLDVAGHHCHHSCVNFELGVAVTTVLMPRVTRRVWKALLLAVIADEDEPKQG